MGLVAYRDIWAHWERRPGGFFLLVAILMFRSVVRDQDLRLNNTTTFGNALQSLRVSEPHAVALPLLAIASPMPSVPSTQHLR